MCTLEPRTRADLDEIAAEYDAAVALDTGVDPFCTRSDWLLPFHDAFAPDRPLHVARAGESFLCFAERHHPALGPYLEPLENSWGFASPLVGADSGELLANALADAPVPLLLLGLPIDGDRLAPLSRMRRRWGARRLEPRSRWVARLEGGLDAWLAGRSPAFRRNLRAAERRVAAAGVELDRRRPDPSDLGSLYREVLAVEARSWKGRAGQGADRPPMRDFYAAMWPRLARTGHLRVLLARRGADILGYLHGALVDGRFRGLQFSFDAAARPLGLGNVLQLEMLRWLCEEGATAYDLGTASEYKRRWAPEGLTTAALFLRPL